MMGNCCQTASEEEGNPDHVSDEQQHGPITSKQAHSSYLREKLKAKEERQPLLSTTDRKANQPGQRHDGMVDPREAGRMRGEKLREAERATDDMKRAAESWTKKAAMLKKL